MRFWMIVCVCALSAHAEWFRNPIALKALEGGFELREGAYGYAVRDELPRSREVEVEGLFELGNGAATNNWRVAAVAVQRDDKNYWHLGLVQAPAGHPRDFFFELAEMLDGQWLAQNSLELEFAQQEPDVAFAEGSRWHLRIAMDEKGVTGVVRDGDGRTIFRRRYLFSARAVTGGRPAIRTTGLGGRFTEVKFAARNPEAAATAAAQFPPYRSDHYVKQVRSEATGYFYVKQFPDGRWWAIDPLGRGVVVLGVDHTTFWGHWCEKLGYAPYRRKNEQKYPDPAVWEEETLARLKAWGFTMLGAGSQDSLMRRGLFHCVNLGMGEGFARCGAEFYITPEEGRPCTAFPNVFHPDFGEYCRFVARSRCAPYADDPWLFGWFIDNELAWWGRGRHESGLFDAAMQFEITHTAKQALVEYLRERAGGSIDQFNAVWGTRCAAFSDVGRLMRLDASTDERVAAKRGFLKLAAERYFSVTAGAIRAAAPRHMIMGARFAGTGGADPVVWQVAGQYSDVVSFNSYPKADLDRNVVYSGFESAAEPVTEHFRRFYDDVKKPMLITEWSFPALDAGLPSVHGAGQRFLTQSGRTAATKLFAQTMLSLPFLIGYDYFMWVDEPELGISATFPEDSNYGLVNEDNWPYPLLTEMFAGLHADLWGARTAPPPPERAAAEIRVLTAQQAAARLRARAADAAAVVVRSEGDRYVIDNGRLTLEGRRGGGRVFDRVSLDGTLFGSYSAMLHFLCDQGANQWRDIQRVTAFTLREEGGCAVLEVTGENRAGPEFEITHRIFVAPESTQFICELVGIRNTGGGRLPVKAAFFRFYGADDQWDVASSPPNVWGVPEYGHWSHTLSGAWYGALASAAIPGMKIHFWKDLSYKSYHPDARCEMEVTLEPGGVFRPRHPVWLVGLAGTGGAQSWMTELKAARSYLEEQPQ